MGAVIKASVALAVLVEIVSVVFTAAKLHQAGLLFGLVFLVLVLGLNVAVILWALGKTAADSGYLRQLGNAALIGVVGGILICLFSYLNMTVFFPNYLEESKTASIEALEKWNMPKEVLDAQVAKVEAQTTFGAAFQGTIGTFFWSLLVGAIVAIFKRARRAEA